MIGLVMVVNILLQQVIIPPFLIGSVPLFAEQPRHLLANLAVRELAQQKADGKSGFENAFESKFGGHGGNFGCEDGCHTSQWGGSGKTCAFFPGLNCR